MTIDELEEKHPFIEIDNKQEIELQAREHRTWWQWLTTSQSLFWNWPNDETLDN